MRDDEGIVTYGEKQKNREGAVSLPCVLLNLHRVLTVAFMPSKRDCLRGTTFEFPKNKIANIKVFCLLFFKKVGTSYFDIVIAL